MPVVAWGLKMAYFSSREEFSSCLRRCCSGRSAGKSPNPPWLAMFVSAVRPNTTLSSAFDCRRKQHCSQLCAGSRNGPDAYRNQTLIVYSHHEPEENQTSFEAATSGEGARANLRFFIQEGVLGKSAPAMDEAHFVFVINGRRLGVELPIRPNVQRYNRENVGFEFCGVAEVLTMLASQ